MAISISCFLSLVTLNLILNLDSVSSNPANIAARVLVFQDRSVEDGYKVQIESNGENKELQLTPLEDIWSDAAQIFQIKRNEGEKILERKSIPKNVKIYHDQVRGSFLTIKEGKVNGILDSKYMIRSEGENHFISRSTFKEGQKFRNDYIIPEENTTISYASRQNLERNSSFNYRSANSYTVEVAVIVDSTLSGVVGSDQQVYEYTTIFWNAVKARFDTIDFPKITIRLVGCYIIRNPEDEPFITKNKKDNDKAYGGKVLSDSAEWVYQHLSMLPPHDTLYVQTGLDLIDSGGSTGLAGIAFLSGTCKKNSNSFRSIAVALGDDVDGAYEGWHTAAHELAHNLGAPHDNDVNGGTGDCPWEDAYIMSYEGAKINNLFFSPCSKDKMAKYLEKPEASCTTENLSKTKPEGTFTSSILPGQVITMDEQCRAMAGQRNASVYMNVNSESELCINLKCNFYIDGRKMIMWTGTGAVEGSECPSGKRCKNGECTSSKLPGRIMTMDEQCQDMTGQSNSTVFKNVKEESELCNILKCYKYERGNTYIVWTSRKAAEGSECPSGKQCRNGECTSKFPGHMKTMDEQCKDMTGQSNSTVYKNVKEESELCNNLKCYKYENGNTYIVWTHRGAAEGSECPSGKHCKSFECI